MFKHVLVYSISEECKVQCLVVEILHVLHTVYCSTLCTYYGSRIFLHIPSTYMMTMA
jgi:hypothetical protein